MPLLTNNVAFVRTIADGLTLSSTSTFTAGSPATNVQHTRPRTVGRSTDTSSGTPAYITFDMGGANIDGAYEAWQVEDSPSTFVDQRDEFNSTATADCAPFPATEAVDDFFAMGYPEPFKGIIFTLSTNGVGGVMASEYWNGTAWTALGGLSDGTSNLTGNGTLNWGMPVDWARTTINSGASLYYIRVRVTTVYSTNPVISQGVIKDEQLDPVNLVACPMYLEHDGVPGSLKWRLRTDNNSDVSSPTYDSGSAGLRFEHPWADRDYAHAFLNPYDDDTTIGPARYARFDFWAEDATYIDIGRIYLGKLFQPTVNIAFGSSTPSSQEKPRRLPGDLGQEFSSAGRAYTSTAGTLQFSTEAEGAQTFSELVEFRGTNRDLVYIHDPKTSTLLQQQLIYGRFDSLAPMNLPRMNFWSLRYSFSSVR